MSSSIECVEYAVGQMREAGDITYRKMFGEYGVYCNGKIFALICDDQLFIKITKAGKALRPDLTEAPPYDGAKPYLLIEDVEDSESLCELVRVTYEDLPVPNPKKPKKR